MRLKSSPSWLRAPLHRLVPQIVGVGILAMAPAWGAAPTPAAKQASSCVTCHTDAEKLKAESAGIPQPKGSALQAGKG